MGNEATVAVVCTVRSSQFMLYSPVYVCVCRSPVGVAVALMAWEVMVGKGMRGKGFRVVHLYEDHLWWVGGREEGGRVVERREGGWERGRKGRKGGGQEGGRRAERRVGRRTGRKMVDRRRECAESGTLSAEKAHRRSYFTV